MINSSITLRPRAGNLRPFSGFYEIVFSDKNGNHQVFATEMDYDAAEALMVAISDGRVSLEYPTND